MEDAIYAASRRTSTDIGAKESDGWVSFGFIFMVFLVLSLGAGGVALVVFLAKRMNMVANVNEGALWSYIGEDLQENEDLDAADMRELLDNGKITFDTLVKLNWMTDFYPVSKLFPDKDQAFQVSPAPVSTTADNNWIRKSHHPETMKVKKHLWFYISPDGTCQGPFEAEKMVHWQLEGLLPMTTPIRMDNADGAFRPIVELFPDEDEAFMVNPKPFPDTVSPVRDSQKASGDAPVANCSLEDFQAEIPEDQGVDAEMPRKKSVTRASRCSKASTGTASLSEDADDGEDEGDDGEDADGVEEDGGTSSASVTKKKGKPKRKAKAKAKKAVKMPEEEQPTDAS